MRLLLGFQFWLELLPVLFPDMLRCFNFNFLTPYSVSCSSIVFKLTSSETFVITMVVSLIMAFSVSSERCTAFGLVVWVFLDSSLGRLQQLNQRQSRLVDIMNSLVLLPLLSKTATIK